MIPLYNLDQYNKTKSNEFLPFQCKYCGNTFLRQKREIKYELKKNRNNSMSFCTRSCHSKSNNKGKEKQLVVCKNCNKEFLKFPKEIEKYPNHFCSHSCSASYNNTHKSSGNRRSKLEIWLERQLTLLYPDLKIFYNNTEAINSELDIYIPSFKLAFELNGIFHYEPIFGEEKLNKIQNNDERKFQACLEKQIELVLIDSSSQKYFKEKTSEKFLKIIVEIINGKLN